MLIVTNRNIKNSTAADNSLFGEHLSEDGATEVRLANVTKIGGRWIVDLIPEPPVLVKDNLPSKHAFNDLIVKCKSNSKNILFFVHGYNKSFTESLEQGWDLQDKYNVEVVVFSWPSNTGGFVMKEYKAAKRDARISTGALDSIFEKMAAYIKVPFDKKALDNCDVSISLMTYSLGNFLFQSFIEGSDYEDETLMFANIVLCQADCDSKGHELWVDRILSGKRVYITINENDKILGWSDANFQRDRLGRTAKNLKSEKAIYFDFTESSNVGKEHQIWGYKVNNPNVADFFDRVLNGKRGESASNFAYDANKNLYYEI